MSRIGFPALFLALLLAALPAQAIDPGDVNADGVVDVGDAVLLGRYLAGDVASVPGVADVAPVVDDILQPDGTVDVGDLVVLLRIVAGRIDPNPPTLGSYMLVADQDLGGGVHEYTYSATITNNAADRPGVQATLESGPAGVEIVDGALSFGAVLPLAMLGSADTFAIRYDTNQGALDLGALVWHFANDGAATVPVLGTPPKSPMGVATPMVDATSFLYEGANPVQTGVAAGTIEAERVGVLRGTVTDQRGAALPGVSVRVVGHPEFGETFSRADGEYDLAANGGAPMTLHFQKSGLVPAYRTVDVPWRTFTQVPDLVMVQRNSTTQIDLSDPAAFQVVQGPSVTDALGTRHAVLLFPQGTTASAVVPGDPTPQVLNQPIHVGVTELTVGSTAVQALPATIGPGTDPTYVFEFSVPEAEALGATSTQFSNPVIFYLENNIGTPVGTSIGFAAFDDAKAAFSGQPSGVVLQIVSENGGEAQTNPDAGTLGLATAELQLLAQLYAPGQQLRRYTTTHFSYGCGHTPPIFPPGAEDPKQDTPKTTDGEDNCDCTASQSVIRNERQVWGESVPIADTPFSLHYESDRVPGYQTGYSLDIPITGATLPGPLQEIRLQVYVAGQRLAPISLPLTTNQTYHFTWNGFNAYGQPMRGRQPIRIELGYGYDAIHDGARGRGFKTQVWNGMIGPWDATGVDLGGWMLSAHHAYDPSGRVLYRGDGGRRTAANLPEILEIVAGGGTTPVADGLDATDASFSQKGVYSVAATPDGGFYLVEQVGVAASSIWRVDPSGVLHSVAFNISEVQGIATGPDGSLYFTQHLARLVRRVQPDGSIVTVAGNGVTGTVPVPNDGDLALQSSLNAPSAVAVTSDGNLYIADYGHLRVFRVSPDGHIRTVAGNGSGYTGDGPGTSIGIGAPYGLALDERANLYISISNAGRVLRLDPLGQIQLFAGKDPNQGTDLNNGGPAVEATLDHPVGLAAAPDGSLYIAMVRLVRRVTPDGLIATVAGIPNSSGVGPDKLPGTRTALGNPSGLSIAHDGSLLISGVNPNHTVRRLRPPLPGFAVGEFLVPSEDGRELYRFDAAGRHLETRDALTGATLLTVEYTPDDGSNVPPGLLDTITDADQNQTKILRDNNGNPTGIRAPFGQVTQLALSTDPLQGPFLASIKNPANDETQITYYPDQSGLVQTFRRPEQVPSGGATTLTFDTDGRLLVDADPENGSYTLARTETPASRTITTTTALGRQKSVMIDLDPTGDKIETLHGFDGLDTVTTHGTDGVDVTGTPDGTTLTTEESPDPRFDLAAPFPGSLEIALPGGSTYVRRHTRTATYDAQDNLTQLLDTISVNPTDPNDLDTGKKTTRTYTAPVTGPPAQPATIETVSPVGRRVLQTLDDHGRVTQTQMGTGSLYPVRFEYDAQGRLAFLKQGVTGTDERVTQFTYDPVNGDDDDGRLRTVTDPLGHDVMFSYDSAGRVTKQTVPDTLLPATRDVGFGYDRNGNLTSLVPPKVTGDPDPPAHAFQYDGRNDEIQYTPPAVVPNPETIFGPYTADRELDLVQRPDGHNIDLVYEPTTGRLQDVRLLNGPTPEHEVHYDYYGALEASPGLVKTIRDLSPGIEHLDFAYDGSLLTSQTWSGTLSGSVNFTYDNDLRLATEAVGAPGGDTVTYVYDDDNLLEAVDRSGVPELDLVPSPETGLLTGTTLDQTATSQTYNAFGELAHVQATVGGIPVYDVSLDDGASARRDALGRIVTKTETVAPDSSSTTTVYGYDDAGRLATVTVGGTLVRHYRYDANANRLSADPSDPTQIAFYDAQDRLLSYAGTTYSYDANGDLESQTGPGGTTTYTYDALGNLTDVQLPDGTQITYVIDGRNRRIGKKVCPAPCTAPATPTLVQGFLYRDQLNPVAELDDQGNVVAQFVYASRPNVPDYMIKNGSVYRIISDHLGSVRLVIDTSNPDPGTAIVQRIDYDEWGVVTNDTNPGFQPFAFAGGIYDLDTRLLRFDARDFDSAVGRWTTRDPIHFDHSPSTINDFILGIYVIGFNGGTSTAGRAADSADSEGRQRVPFPLIPAARRIDTNLYTYVANDPIDFNDPIGLYEGADDDIRAYCRKKCKCSDDDPACEVKVNRCIAETAANYSRLGEGAPSSEITTGYTLLDAAISYVRSLLGKH